MIADLSPVAYSCSADLPGLLLEGEATARTRGSRVAGGSFNASTGLARQSLLASALGRRGEAAPPPHCARAKRLAAACPGACPRCHRR